MEVVHNNVVQQGQVFALSRIKSLWRWKGETIVVSSMSVIFCDILCKLSPAAVSDYVPNVFDACSVYVQDRHSSVYVVLLSGFVISVVSFPVY